VTSGQTAAPPKRRRSKWVDLLAVGALVAVLLYLHTRVVRVVYVTTGSMMTTINPGDRLLVHLSAYNDHPPRRGDIVAFWAEDEGDYEVKRVIAVEGDVLTILWGAVLLNAEPLEEPYISQAMLPEQPAAYPLKQGELFLMGDNRNESEDSRDYGPVYRDRVMGRVFYRILPLGRIGPVR
jgi:signal peptidase I